MKEGGSAACAGPDAFVWPQPSPWETCPRRGVCDIVTSYVSWQSELVLRSAEAHVCVPFLVSLSILVIFMA